MMTRTIWIRLVTAVVAFVSLAAPASDGMVYSLGFGSGNATFVDDAIIVEFKEDVDIDALTTKVGKPLSGIVSVDAVLGLSHAKSVDRLFPGVSAADKDVRNLGRFVRVNLQPGQDIQSILDLCNSDPHVKSAEPIGIHRVAIDPNDPSFSQQWNLKQSSDKDVDATDAWDITTGDTNVIIGICDTGVKYAHGDLGGSSPYVSGNIWVNWPEYEGAPGVDDDGNGYVDDVRGWDWVNVGSGWSGEDLTTPDNDPTDFNGHGTHCAGIVSARTNNSTGVAGIAGGWSPNAGGVKIMPLRIGWSAPDPQYGYEVGYVRMDYAAQAFLYAKQKGAVAINCSWGSSNTGGLAAALNAIKDDVVICKAAGNDGQDAADYLCSQPSVLSVASTTSGDKRSSFSNYGTWVDVSAPGSSIYSTYSNHGSATYATLSGTSMAAPHVAGLAALIKSRNPQLTKNQIDSIIVNSTDNIDALNPGYEGKLGSGRINAYKAVTSLVYATFHADQRAGAPPLEVSFTGSSPFSITEWLYRFGDGDSAYGQNAVHIYSAPGAYDVSLRVTSEFGENTTSEAGYVLVVADTMNAEGSTRQPADTKTAISIDFTNNVPISEMYIPLVYPGTLSMTLDSASIKGTRCEYFERMLIVVNVPAQKELVVNLKADNGGGAPPLSPGAGPVLKLYFHHAPVAGDDSATVDTSDISGYTLVAKTPYSFDYVPAWNPGVVSGPEFPCGDAGSDNMVDIDDIVYLISYVFGGGPGTSLNQGDVNGSGEIDVDDIVYLIEYVFGAGPSPVC